MLLNMGILLEDRTHETYTIGSCHLITLVYIDLKEDYISILVTKSFIDWCDMSTWATPVRFGDYYKSDVSMSDLSKSSTRLVKLLLTI